MTGMDSMAYQVNHFINGKEVSTKTNTQNLFNPATGEVIGQVLLGDKPIVDQAVESAQKAFPAWSSMPAIKRARILFKFKILLEQHLDELANLITREHGKTLTDARGSVQRGIEVVEYVLGVPNHLKGAYAESVARDVDTYSIRQPLGVCIGITPFNFPAMIPLWMFSMAIACGNTFVLKPSEKDPSCSIRLAELAKEAGIPDGVLNVVQGDKEAVHALLTHTEVKAVSFVGSSAIAEYVYKTAAATGKRVQAFGGAKNHCVVMPDVDLDPVADAIVGAAYGSAGERCMAISVVVAVGDSFANDLVKKLKPRIQQLKLGKGTSAESELGPLITKAHWERVNHYIEIGLQEGADLVIDGRHTSLTEGFFMSGSLFDNVQPSMQIYREEIFGPVLSIVRVSDLQSAIALISQHDYGNGAAIFTQSGYNARKFAHEVQIGMVGINIPIPVPPAYFSFGGWKRSLFGDLNMYGPEGIQFYTKLKTVTQRWLSDEKGPVFGMPIH